jgi:hypothetical protein
VTGAIVVCRRDAELAVFVHAMKRVIGFGVVEALFENYIPLWRQDKPSDSLDAVSKHKTTYILNHN